MCVYLLTSNPLSILYLSHWPLYPAKRKSFYLSYLTAFEEWEKSLDTWLCLLNYNCQGDSFLSPLFTLILTMFWVPLTILKQDNVDSGAYCEEELPSYMVKFSFPSQVWWTSIKLIPKARIKVQITKNLFSHFFSAFTLGPKKGWTLVCWLFLEKA